MSATTIRETIEKTSRVLAEQPEKAKSKNVPATARLLDGLRCEVTGPNGETLHTDMPPAMGGAASAPVPGWVLRAAVASCTATAIAMRAARLGVDLTTLEVTVESYSDNRGLLGLDDKISAGLSSLATRVKLGAPDTAADQLRELAQWGDHHSPVACTTRIPRSRWKLSVRLGSNPAFERTAASTLRLLAAPSSLRSSAPAHRER